MSSVEDGAEFVLIKPWLEGEDRDELISRGLPEAVVEYMSETDAMILMPNRPAVIEGVERWAWLEIDGDSYETIGVLDSFERGAMVSNVIIDTVKNSGQFMVGGFVGVSTSIWSVAGVSLQESDYDKILKEAKAFALGLKDSFGVKKGVFSSGIGGTPEISQSFGPIKVSFNGKGGISQDVVGFTQGFEAGVNYYFEKAK